VFRFGPGIAPGRCHPGELVGATAVIRTGCDGPNHKQRQNDPQHDGHRHQTPEHHNRLRDAAFRNGFLRHISFG
jgi:hypothetical protein